jgi:hypothetical protein
MPSFLLLFSQANKQRDVREAPFALFVDSFYF